MTCPKCGRKLIIGSTLCPDCDVLEKPKKTKSKRKLTRHGKIIIASACAIAALVFLVCIINVLSGFKVVGADNGNGVNLDYAEKIGNHFYYSTGGTLSAVDKKFKNSEIVDRGSDIYCLTECGEKLYYIKDGVLCRYCPKKRVISEIAKIPSDKKAAVLAKSERDIYYSAGEGIYKLSCKSLEMTHVLNGEGIICGSSAYVFRKDGVYKIKLSGGEEKKICDTGEFDKPLFVRGGDIYAVNYKEMKIFTIDRKSGEKTEVFDCADYKNISDATKANISGKYIYIAGVDGIYKVNSKNGEAVLLGETGFVNSVCIEDKHIFSRRFDGVSYFSDLSGKILYEIRPDSGM